ncbi:hypothetical protein C8R43DRAFT_960441 [Mycena crocata]|nr:hypothetical protein C8R43DRAFT_960441 [Mycena crocata]
MRILLLVVLHSGDGVVSPLVAVRAVSKFRAQFSLSRALLPDLRATFLGLAAQLGLAKCRSDAASLIVDADHSRRLARECTYSVGLWDNLSDLTPRAKQNLDP